MINKKINGFFIHFSVWICFMLLPILFLNPSDMSNFYMGKWTLNVIFAAVFFYLNIFFILPKFLKKDRWLLYSAANILILILIIIQQYIAENIFQGMVFDKENVSFLIICRALVIFFLIFFSSNRLYHRFVEANE